MADNDLTPPDALEQLRSAIRKEPGWEYGTVLPMRWQGEGKDRRFEFAAPDMVRDLGHGAIDLLQGPQRAGAYLRGDLPPQEVVTPNALLTLGGGGTGLAQTAPKGAIGIFGGPLARDAAIAELETARKLLRYQQKPENMWQGFKNFATKTFGMDKSPEEVWQRTGWTNEFADKKWRFEIPDADAKLIPRGLVQMNFSSPCGICKPHSQQLCKRKWRENWLSVLRPLPVKLGNICAQRILLSMQSMVLASLHKPCPKFVVRCCSNFVRYPALMNTSETHRNCLHWTVSITTQSKAIKKSLESKRPSLWKIGREFLQKACAVHTR